MKFRKILMLGVVTALMAPLSALAHTISIGTLNAGAPGSVEIFMGTYASGHGVVAIEGAITLNATLATFGNLVNTKPAGLVDGSNNFFGSTSSPAYVDPVNNTGLAEVFWQSAVFTGLSAGTYSYTISGMNTVNWANLDTGGNSWTGSLVIPDSSIAVPAPATLALFGLGLVGLGFVRRSKA